MSRDRAWMLLKSGRRLDLLNPDPDAWTDEDLATRLARTYRWGSDSKWPLPLSVAQHSITVLRIRELQCDHALTAAERLREVLHDADEGLLGYDAIAPLKPYLGDGYDRIVARLQQAIQIRYGLQPWDCNSYAAHKQADRLAAASEAYHVVGWPAADIRCKLGIAIAPLETDPVIAPPGAQAWEPWPSRLAADMFLRLLQDLHWQVMGVVPGSARSGDAIQLIEGQIAHSRHGENRASHRANRLAAGSENRDSINVNGRCCTTEARS
jgi:hypothetical protein